MPTRNYFKALFLCLAFCASVISGLHLFAQEQLLQTVSFSQSGFAIDITSLELFSRVGGGEKLFSRVQASEIGIDHASVLSPDHFIPPYWNGRGIGAGDYNKDGYVDLVFASATGVRLFENRQGQRFSEIDFSVPGLEDKDVFITALVDWDNDGWLDLFFTSYADGNFWIRNDRGKFESTMESLIGSPLVLTKALSFGDVDRDGDIDAALGNWYFGYLKHIPPEDSKNYLILNKASSEESEYNIWLIPGITGETLSILLSDFSGDGILDMMVGNDFAPPDYYYTGLGDGRMQVIKRDDKVIPVSTTTTMSLDTGDFDNDLDLDIFSAQIAAPATGEAARVLTQDWSRYCDEIIDSAVQTACRKSVEQRFLFGFGSRHEPGLIKNCEKIEENRARQGCLSMMILLTAVRSNQIALCDKISLEHTQFTCKNYFKPHQKRTEKQRQEAVFSKPNANVFLVSDDGKSFEDRSAELNVEVTGWSWNAKFADFDNDQWQDIFVVNGTWIRNLGTPQKFFYRNENGKGFTEEAEESGLQNFMLQSAYVELDVDNDGDLDIIANSTSGPIWFYRNNEKDNHAIQFEFSDEIGNHYGIGNKITLKYGFFGLGKQMRELKSGGGFLSFSSPIIHFGLGDVDIVDSIDIEWSTGETIEVKGPFLAGFRYKLSRKTMGLE